MQNLSSLKNKIKTEFDVEPKVWDGLNLEYSKVKFGLISVDDKWIIKTKDDTVTLSTKEFKAKLPKLKDLL